MHIRLVKHTLTGISPLRAAVIAAVAYAAIGLVVISFFLLSAFFGEGPVLVGIILAVAVPLFYAAMGFVGTLLTCWAYNVVGRYTGGIEVDVAGSESERDVSSI